MIGVRRRREQLGKVRDSACLSMAEPFTNSDSKGICARIAADGARCIICLSETVKNEHVILFPCGHWVQRVCYHLWFARGYQMKCPYKCEKDQEGFRSAELMSAEVCLSLKRTSVSVTNARQHDVNEAELTDVEDLLERDRQVAEIEDTVNLPTRPPPTAPRTSSSHLPPTHSLPYRDSDVSYDGDVEEAQRNDMPRVRRSRQQARRRARRREMMERGLQELAEQDQDTQQEDPRPSGQPKQRPPGWFFDEAITDGGDDFGMSDGLTLAQRMYNLPPGRRFL